MSTSCRLQADCVIVSSQEILAPGQVVLKDGLIQEVTGRTDERADVRLDGLALMPRLVNVHTHLEFSDLAAPLPAGASFVEWIRAVLAQRRERPQTVASLQNAIATGMRESHGFGIGCIGDIVTPPWRQDVLRLSGQDAPGVELPDMLAECFTGASRRLFSQHVAPNNSLPRVQAFIEQLGSSTERIEQAVAWAQSIGECQPDDRPARLGELAYSPHAPYSTGEELFRRTLATAKNCHAVVAMHLAESPDEREWLDAGTGAMADFLRSLGIESAGPTRGYLERLLVGMSECERSLVVHGNYLTTAELDEIARHGDRQSVVYCPRTHRHFGHQPYPLAAMRARGLRVVLATDSRATNPDLNLWQEARTALDLHSSLLPSEAFDAITNSAAFALRVDPAFGRLARNKLACLCVVPMPRSVANISDREAFLEHIIQTTHHPMSV